MLPFVVFLCVVALVWGFLGYEAAYWKGYNRASEDHWPEACEHQLNEQWTWLLKANARRKRVERALRRQRALNETLDRINGNLLADIRYLLDENKKATSLARSLAGELVGEVLATQDQESVIKGLTRKL